MKTEPDFRNNAIKYVNAQLETMRNYGSAPVLSTAEFVSLVDECEAVGRKIWERSRAEEARKP